MKIPLSAIFAGQSALQIGAMVAIITSFVLVTNRSVEVAVGTATDNNLNTLVATIRTIIRETEPTAFLGTELSINAWGDYGSLFQTEARPNIEDFNRSFSLFTGMLMKNPKFAYAYQSFETNVSKWTDLSCGAFEGTYSCTAGSWNASDYYINGPIPLNYTVTEIIERDASEDLYILEIRSMTPAHVATGYWQRPGFYYDPGYDATLALMTFSVPTTFDPIDGRCTSGFSIDVSIDEVGLTLQRLADKGNFMYVFSAQHVELVASSLPTSRLPITASTVDETGEQSETMWPATATPDDETNRGASLVVEDSIARFGSVTVADGSGTLSLDDIDVIVTYKHLKVNTLHWILVDHTPRDYYFGEARRLRTILIVIAALVVAACLAVCVAVYFAVVRPIATMSAAMHRISRLERGVIPRKKAYSAQSPGDASLDMQDGEDDLATSERLASDDSGPVLAELRPIHDAFLKLDLAMQSFTRYVPRGVVKELIESNQLCQLTMAPRNCSILFADIAGFTTLSERVPAPELSRLIHTYFSRMSHTVMLHNGIIDKFIGDCVMAVWGAPFPQKNHEMCAALCALAMDAEARSPPLSTQFDEAGERLTVRIGVNCGEVLAGNMGSDDRMNYTVIGDEVNLAARCEGLNKAFGTRVMLTENVVRRLHGKLVTRLLCRVNVVGKSKAIAVYEPRGVNPLTTDTIHGSLRGGDLNEVLMSSFNSSSSMNLEGSGEASDSYSVLDSASEAGEQHDPDKEHRATTLLRRARTRSEVDVKEVDFAAKYTEAVSSLITGDFASALRRANEVQQAYPHWTQDRAFDYLHDTATHYLQSPPKDYDGAYHASEK
jgi:class 3 adenylate cyclase